MCECVSLWNMFPSKAKGRKLKRFFYTFFFCFSSLWAGTIPKCYSLFLVLHTYLPFAYTTSRSSSGIPEGRYLQRGKMIRTQNSEDSCWFLCARFMLHILFLVPCEFHWFYLHWVILVSQNMRLNMWHVKETGLPITIIPILNRDRNKIISKVRYMNVTFIRQPSWMKSL